MKYLSLLVLFGLVACGGGASDSYRGYLYPDRTNLSNHIYLGTFDNYDDCAAEVQDHYRYKQSESDFECVK